MSTPNPKTVLALTDVSKQYGTVHALSHVSLDVRGGEIHAVVGENGSGKSTLLGIASGFVEPDGGTVLIGGKPLHTDSPADARRLAAVPGTQEAPGGNDVSGNRKGDIDVR